MDMPATFGTWLRQQREARDLTRVECAALIGCSPDSLRKIEYDLRRPSKAMAARILDVLHAPSTVRPALLALARQSAIPDEPGSTMSSSSLLPTAHPSPTLNLPQPLGPLIGRVQEVSSLMRTLLHPSTRLLTLVGPPGVGKSRLALALGTILHENDIAVAWIPLSAVNDPTHILPTLLSALDITPGSADSLRTLIAVLERQPWVLIVDNLEHLLDGTPLLSELLMRVDTLRIVATSREPLMLSGEQIREVKPLDLPPPDASDATSFYLSPAVQLLLQQRTAVTGFMDLDPAHLPAVVELCRILDGLPLALELAAMQLQYMSLPALYAQITTMLPQLTYRWRDREPRQHSLWGALASSVATLDPKTQHLLYSLSVWRGGWTLDSLETVAGAGAITGPALMEQVHLLADKHLINGVPDAVEPRWTMLHVIREYAAHHLHNADVVQARHARWFRNFASEADEALRGQAQDRWLTRLDEELHNLRSAMTWGLENRDPTLALTIAANLYLFWNSRAWYTEGRAWLIQTLAAAADAPLAERAKAWKVLGVLMMRQGAMADSLLALTESLQIYQSLGDQEGQAAVLNNIGVLYMDQGQWAAAQQAYEQSVGLIRAAAARNLWLLAVVTGNLGVITEKQGYYAAAQKWAEECLDLRRRLGDQMGIAMALMNLGVVAEKMGELPYAQRLCEESLTLSEQLGDQRTVAMCLRNLGVVAALQNHVAAAERHYIRALALFTTAGDLQGQIMTYASVGRLRMHQGQPVTAATALIQASDLASTTNHRALMLEIAIQQVELAVDQGALGEAWASLQALAPALLDNRALVLDAADLAALILQHDPASAAAATQLWRQSQLARRSWGIPMSMSSAQWAARHGSTTLAAGASADDSGEDAGAVVATLARLVA